MNLRQLQMPDTLVDSMDVEIEWLYFLVCIQKSDVHQDLIDMHYPS
jgi:hypothetical protein